MCHRMYEVANYRESPDGPIISAWNRPSSIIYTQIENQLGSNVRQIDQSLLWARGIKK